ncbi:MAG: hypothetical protein SH808_05520 [Saprospiraceae bacterium]|nr:hypothetical protein [Saprospiraceae bacterium]
MNTIKLTLGIFSICLAGSSYAQRIGIGTNEPHLSSALDITSSDKGILIPRMSSAQRNAIGSPTSGLMVYVTDPVGFWYFNGSIWTTLGTGGGGGSSSAIEDTDGDTKVDAESAPNEDLIRFKTAGIEVMCITNEGKVGIGTDMPGGTLDVAGDIQAGLFIDRATPQYYLDPGSNATSMSVAGSVKASLFSDASSSAYFLDPGSAGISLKTAGYIQSTIYYDDANLTYWLDPGNVGTSLKVAGKLDGSLFQDKDNISFLVDPASTSILNNLTLNTLATGPNAGLKIRTQSQEYWSINGVETGDQDLGFWFNGIPRATMQWDFNVGDLDFTAQHRSLPAEGIASDYKDMVGYIVVSDGTINNLDGSTTPCINESLPRVKLADTENDKRIYGVIARVEEKDAGKDNDYREYAQGAFVTMIERADTTDYRLVINSAGEGGIWVSNWNGAMENGDLVTTSPIPGIGMKQEDDLIHNYTVAKIVMDCDFRLDDEDYVCKEVEHNGKTYRMAFLACVYKL